MFVQFMADHRVKSTADATAILHKTWGKAALKTINAEVFVDHDMVMEEIAAYKKLHTDWKSKGSETWKTCHEEDPGLCQGMGVPLHVAIFSARTRLALQVLECGIGVAIVDLDTVFLGTSIGLYLNALPHFDMLVPNEMSFTCAGCTVDAHEDQEGTAYCGSKLGRNEQPYKQALHCAQSDGGEKESFVVNAGLHFTRPNKRTIAFYKVGASVVESGSISLSLSLSLSLVSHGSLCNPTGPTPRLHLPLLTKAMAEASARAYLPRPGRS
jgi:hypothetical protein